MKIIKGIEQGTLEWQALRRGVITGTKLGDVLGTPLAQKKLIACLLAEEGTEQTKIIRASAEMERGVAEEIFAVKAFEKKFKKKVERVTLCISDPHPWVACSPDGLIKDKNKKYTEQLEVKNPDSATMISYRLGEGLCDLNIPKDYKWQVVDAFLVNEDLERLYFVVYDARFIEEEHRMLVTVVERADPALHRALLEAEIALETFRVEWLRCKELVLPSNF